MATISEFGAAVNQICAERGIDPEEVYGALEAAILAAYKKDYGGQENMSVEVDRVTGEVQVIADKEVVKKVTDDELQISIEDAQSMEPNLKEGDHVEIEISVEGFGRIAAQTAKQVILQKMRESEKEAVLDEFRDKVGTVVTGLVQRMIGPMAVVEIGKGTAHMPPDEQIPNEFYKIGERYKFYLKEIRDEHEIIVSRGAPEFLIELFKLEVPEMDSGIIEIKAVAREAGSRSKVAVVSHQDGVDPIGSCVGQKGMRIANVMSEIGEEKIDIIEWADRLEDFIANALGPAQVEKVEIVEEGAAKVHVSDDQLSLAIGKDGQNVRLAAKLTNMKIDITAPGLDDDRSTARPDDSVEGAQVPELSTRVANALEKAGVSVEDVMTMEDSEIEEIDGIGGKSLEEIKEFKQSMSSPAKESKEESAQDAKEEDASKDTDEDDSDVDGKEENDDSNEKEADEKEKKEDGSDDSDSESNDEEEEEKTE